MLNTDMELAYDIDVDGRTGTSCCVNECYLGVSGSGTPRGRGARGSRGGQGWRGGRGRDWNVITLQENENICPDARTKYLVRRYAHVSTFV